MSSILKALRTLEEEKSARSDRPVRFAWDVLRPSREMTARRRISLSRGAGLALLGIVALGGGWIAGKPASVTRPQPPISVTGFLPVSSTVDPIPERPGVADQQVRIHTVAVPGLRLDLIEGTPSGGRLAVINDLPVMEGSMIGDYRVVAILADQVVLTRNDSLYRLTLSP